MKQVFIVTRKFKKLLHYILSGITSTMLPISIFYIELKGSPIILSLFNFEKNNYTTKVKN